MVRLARVVAPGMPHHIRQAGNRREQVFFEQEDYEIYLTLVGTAARQAGTEIWVYCLMPNHVHFVMVPSQPDGLRATFAEAHRRYTSRINSRRGQTGHLWQGRFSSTVLDERHFLAMSRHMSLHPVRSGLAATPDGWRWCSAGAHLSGRDDDIASVRPLLDRIGDFEAFLGESEDTDAIEAVRRSYTTGRPVGAADWIAKLETLTARSLAPRKRGRKPRAAAETPDMACAPS